jgi:hypothetical protein
MVMISVSERFSALRIKRGCVGPWAVDGDSGAWHLRYGLGRSLGESDEGLTELVDAVRTDVEERLPAPRALSAACASPRWSRTTWVIWSTRGRGFGKLER